MSVLNGNPIISVMNKNKVYCVVVSKNYKDGAITYI
jgi:hypothetical protein